MFDVNFTFLVVFINSLYVPFCCVDKEGEIWTVSFSLTKIIYKKLHHTKSWPFYVLELVDSDEETTVE